MRRWALVPVAVFTVLALFSGITGARLLGAPPGVSPDGGPHSSLEDPRAFHRDMGHGFLVAMWILLPLSGGIPLWTNWDRIRRKALAVGLFFISLSGVALFSLLESFTGHLLGGTVLEQISKHSQPSLLRMRAVHVLGFPFLMLLALAAVWLLSVRPPGGRAERIGASKESEPPRSGF